jgi:glycosyltransferase involved in cell wall biosynthesis
MTVSVLIPVRNGGAALADVVEFVRSPLEWRNGENGSDPTTEVVIVDDGSTDDSWEVIKSLSDRNSAVRGLRLDRHRGQQSALLAGFTSCRGDVIITMDDDGAHNPAGIPVLVKKAEAGFDLVYAEPPLRPGGGIRRFASHLHRSLFRRLGAPPGIGVGSYRLLSAKLARRILAAPRPFPYVSALAFSLRPHPRTATVAVPPGNGGRRSRFSVLALIRLEWRLWCSYGPLARARERPDSIPEDPALWITEAYPVRN